MIIVELFVISRPLSSETWHQEKRSATIRGPSQKDLRRNSRNYCPKPATPMDLLFSRLELVALTISIFIECESDWLEGAMLMAVFLILGIGFYYAN